ncbi:MAG: hypothetical protein BGO34_10240 [Bacteroidia bacterium 44-10]|nr:MAG: hypothetical protein BGO34_10240 [Bacteroidia bacterium 44-10]
MKENKKLKVLLCSPYSSKKVGGIGTWSKLLLDYADMQDNIDLSFLNTAFELKGNIQSNKIFRIFLGSIDSIIIILKSLVKIFSFKPDVMHYTSSASYALLKDYIIANFCQCFKVKFVIHYHCGRIPKILKNGGWEKKWLLRVSKKSHHVIVIDNKSFLVLRNILKEKVSYIPNPVSTEVLGSAINTNNTIEREIGRVVYAGHVIKAKGIFELVEACVLISSVKKLVICGPYLPEIKDSLIDISKKRDNGSWVKFKGEIKREEVVEELKKSYIFALPSYTEGFPYAILEAMAMSCAIVATEVGAIPEMLDYKSDNPSGIAVKIGDVDSLKNAIAKLVNDKSLAIELGENGNKKLREKYTLEVIYPEYFTIWNS